MLMCSAQRKLQAQWRKVEVCQRDLHVEVHVSAANKTGSQQYLESWTLKETVVKLVVIEQKGDNPGSVQFSLELISEKCEQSIVKDAVEAPGKSSHKGKFGRDLEEGKIDG